LSKSENSPAEYHLLKIGQQAPDFSVKDDSGQIVQLKQLKGSKVVLYFYPKDHTPGCTQESCDFRDQFAKFRKQGVQIFGVSRDSEMSHASFREKQQLPFSLLADVEGQLTEKYGVWKEKSMYGKKYMGIERTTIVIDEQGKIAAIYPKVSVKGHVDQVWADLNSKK
jgi:peroxiredoxin Q/BCP